MNHSILNLINKAFKEYRFFILSFILLLIYWRSPSLLQNPRLWAEEASFFLEHAMHSDWLNGIIFSPKYTAGYIALAISIPSTIAAHLPLHLAPIITTYFSLVIVLILFGKVIFNESQFFKSPRNKLLISMIILFFPSALSSAETWLNTTNLQVYCACISLIILLSDLNHIKSNRYMFSLGRNILLLIFCCLSGPYSLFLTPAFLYRLYIKRDKTSLVYLITIALMGMIQSSVYLYLKYSNFLSSKKEAEVSILSSLIGVFKNHIIQPILGMKYSEGFLKFIGFSSSHTKNISQDYIVVASIIAIFFILYILKVSWQKEYNTRLLVISFIPVSFLTAIFSIGNNPSGRYAFFPAIIFGLMLLLKGEHFKNKNALQSKVCIILLLVGMITGISEFKEYKKDLFLVKNSSIPSWKEQLDVWSENKRTILTVWPLPRWKFQLSDPKETLKLKASIEGKKLNILTGEKGWSGDSIKLGGKVKGFSVQFDIDAENINPNDIIHLRFIDSNNPKNFYWASVNFDFLSAEKQSFHYDRNMMRKEGNPTFYDLDILEIRVKSIKGNSKYIIDNFNYLSPYASFNI